MIYDLNGLLRGYAALVLVRRLRVPAQLQFAVFQDFLLNSILLNPHLQNYPASKEYRYSFWKWAIQNLEGMASDEDMEIDVRLYDHHLSLLPPSSLEPATPPSQSYITHHWESPLEDKVQTTTLLESRTMIESGTTGLRSWKASFVLAQVLIEHPELVAKKRVLELGAGTGFLGIITASLQILGDGDIPPGAIFMTDANEQVLQRCSYNAKLPCNSSSIHPRVYIRHLDWFDALDSTRSENVRHLVHQEIKPDILLGADIVYDPSLIAPLVAVIELALDPPCQQRSQILLLLALTVRNEDTLEQFLLAARPKLNVIERPQLQPKTVFLGMFETTAQVRIFEFTARHVSAISSNTENNRN